MQTGLRRHRPARRSPCCGLSCRIVLSVATEISTAELFEQAVQGNDSAWNVLVERLSPAIWGAARTCGLNRAEAEDVFGTVWLRLLDRHETIRDPQRLAGWLHSTARNEALAIVRMKSRVKDEPFKERASEEGEVGERLEKQHDLDLLWEALSELDERCRDLLRLISAVPKVPYKAISEHLDMAIGSIGPTRDRCLQKLRATAPVSQIRGSMS